MQNLNFYLVTDTHFFDPSFKHSGAAYEKRSISDQKCVAETPAIIDAGFKQIADDKETNIILIPGDLVYRGEYQSHVGLRNRLYKLKSKAKKYISSPQGTIMMIMTLLNLTGIKCCLLKQCREMNCVIFIKISALTVQ